MRFSDIHLKTKTAEARPAFSLSDVHNTVFRNSSLENQGKSECNFLLEKSSEIQISEITVPGKSGVFAKLNGNGNKNIIITNNFLPGTEKIFSAENGTEKVVRESGNLK
jgi:hypothetical protein